MTSTSSRLRAGAGRADCPSWCVVEHDPEGGEEDWVHRGEPLHLGEGVTAQLVMSADPRTGEQDGPYVLIGSTEYTLEEAAAVGIAISALADDGTRSA